MLTSWFGYETCRTASAEAQWEHEIAASDNRTILKMSTKIFCIGFHKTGTKTLAAALARLGYRVTGPNGVLDPAITANVRGMAYALVAEFDAFQDNPWPILYRELDERFPGSKFILTVRDTPSWIRSQLDHFGSTETPMRRWIYGETAGAPAGNEALYMRRYETHNRDVLEYFAYRPDDLLVMDLAQGDGWEMLCRFLNKDVPDVAFPHENKATDRARRSAAA
jgi:hypothetical protein